MTLEEFFVVFASEAPKVQWDLQLPHTFGRGTRRLLRTHWGMVCCCPVSFLDREAFTMVHVVAERHGLDTSARDALMAAADETPCHEAWIRTRLLTLAGFTEAV